ncbi:MAG: hypothetical protein AAFU65_14810 [Pseudomonadota bacterium]
MSVNILKRSNQTAVGTLLTLGVSAPAFAHHEEMLVQTGYLPLATVAGLLLALTSVWAVDRLLAYVKGK